MRTWIRKALSVIGATLTLVGLSPLEALAEKKIGILLLQSVELI
jgi:hypothetical protein